MTKQQQQQQPDRPWTQRRVNCVLHQIAKMFHRQGRSADEFEFLAEFSPWELGDEFSIACDRDYKKLKHIVPLVWDPAQQCG